MATTESFVLRWPWTCVTARFDCAHHAEFLYLEHASLAQYPSTSSLDMPCADSKKPCVSATSAKKRPGAGFPADRACALKLTGLLGTLMR